MMIESPLYKRVEKEIQTFFELIMVNLVLAALAICFGISYTITQILELVEGGNFIFYMPFIIAIGLVTTFIGIRWILSSVSVLEGVTDVKKEFQERRKNPSETGITSIIVQMLATYREKKPTIKQMSRISQLGGIFFVIGGAAQVLTFALVIENVDTLIVLTVIVGLVTFIGLAAVCLVVPHYFSKYSKAWDTRLAQVDGLKAELKDKMEGN